MELLRVICADDDRFAVDRQHEAGGISAIGVAGVGAEFVVLEGAEQESGRGEANQAGAADALLAIFDGIDLLEEKCEILFKGRFHGERGVIIRNVNASREEQNGEENSQCGGQYDGDRLGALGGFVKLAIPVGIILLGSSAFGDLLAVKTVGIDDGRKGAKEDDGEHDEGKCLHRGGDRQKAENTCRNIELAAEAMCGVPIFLIGKGPFDLDANRAAAHDLGHIIAEQKEGGAEDQIDAAVHKGGIAEGGHKNGAAGDQRDQGHDPKHDMQNLAILLHILIQGGGEENAQPMRCQENDGHEGEEKQRAHHAIGLAVPSPMGDDLLGQKSAAEQSKQGGEQCDDRRCDQRFFISLDHLRSLLSDLRSRA